MEKELMTSEIFESVWDALSDTAQEAENLKVRSALLYEIRKTIEESKHRWEIGSFKFYP